MNLSKNWITILLLAFLLRGIGLDLNPVGLSHDDELHNLINAKSLAITGTNVPGVVAGILTQDGHCLAGDCIYGELESYALIPWMKFFPLDMVLSKIPYLFASAGLVWATGKLFENLSQNKKIGELTGLLLAINPWAIYYGRTAYAYTPTFLLFVLAAYFYTRKNASFKSNLVWGSLSSFGASLFYFGAKAIFPLVILWGVFFNLKQKNLKFIILFLVIISLLITSYFFMLSNSLAGKRFAEIGATNTSVLERVNSYLGFFSPVSLFLIGQKPQDNYFLTNQGYFYLIEFPFLIIGLIAILKKQSKEKLILLLWGIAVLPAAIKITPASIYSLRSGLAYPIMIGIISQGYYLSFKKIPQKKIFLAIIGLIYLISFSYFIFIYWYKAPVSQATRWFFHERVLTNYITRLRNYSHQKVVIISGRPDGIFNSFVFYSGYYENKNNIKEINKSYLNGTFEFKNTKFINDCLNLTDQDLKESVIFTDQVNQLNCHLNQTNTPKIANPKDAGGMFNIINDSLCKSYSLKRFPTPKNIFDFKIENLSDQDFCMNWITNPDNY